MTFKTLELGELFHIGKLPEQHFHKGKDGFMYAEYKKTGPSDAVCIAQYGYGNTRMVGKHYKQSSNSIVFRTG